MFIGVSNWKCLYHPVPLSIYSFQHYYSWTLSDNPYSIRINFFPDLVQKLVSFFSCIQFLLCCFSSLHACVSATCLTLCNPADCSPPGCSVHGDFPGKNTGVGYYAHLQRIFLTQGSNPCVLCLLHWQAGSLPPVPPGNPSSVNGYIQLKVEVKMI